MGKHIEKQMTLGQLLVGITGENVHPEIDTGIPVGKEEWETIDELWAKEAEDRIDAYEHDEINAISVKDVFTKIRR